MNRLLASAVLLLLLPGCALLGNSVKTEDFSTEDLTGVWMLTDVTAERLRIEHLALLADGRKCSVNLSFDAGEGLGELRSKGRWQLADDSIITTLDYSASAWLLEGDMLRQHIVSASASQLQLRWQSEALPQPGPVSTYQRASGVSAQSLCQLAGPREPAAMQAPVAGAVAE